jgi:hypothetical protein
MWAVLALTAGIVVSEETSSSRLAAPSSSTALVATAAANLLTVLEMAVGSWQALRFASERVAAEGKAYLRPWGSPGI